MGFQTRPLSAASGVGPRKPCCKLLGELQPLSEIFVGRGINELHLLGSVTTNSLKIPVATTPMHPMGTGQLSRKLFHSILRCAAAMATGLRVLQCHLEYVVPERAFPVMPHLEHVVLRVTSEDVLPKLAAALPHMRQLQTVHLYNPLHKHVGWNMPFLNLIGCPNLQSIRLGGIAPAGLHLPSSCTVHLDLTSWELACAPVWASLRSVGFLFYDQDRMAIPKGHGGVVHWLDGPVRLDTVCVENITKETALALPAGIAGARHVIICGNDVHLHIPAKNSWKIIEVHACGDLSFDFEDVSAFARNAPAFTVEFVNTKGLGIWSFMKAMGGSWDMRTFSQSTIDFFHLCNRCIDDTRCNFMEDYFEDIQQHGGIYRMAAICKCGACPDCLFAAGNIGSKCQCTTCSMGG